MAHHRHAHLHERNAVPLLFSMRWAQCFDSLVPGGARSGGQTHASFFLPSGWGFFLPTRSVVCSNKRSHLVFLWLVYRTLEFVGLDFLLAQGVAARGILDETALDPRWS